MKSRGSIHCARLIVAAIFFFACVGNAQAQGGSFGDLLKRAQELQEALSGLKDALSGEDQPGSKPPAEKRPAAAAPQAPRTDESARLAEREYTIVRPGNHTIELPVQQSFEDALGFVLSQSQGAAAVWNGEKSRGAVMQTDRFKNEQGQECLEVAISTVTRATAFGYGESMRAYCAKDSDNWIRSDHSFTGVARKLQQVRSFHTEQAAGSVFRVAPGESYLTSPTAAYLQAIAGEPHTPIRWQNATGRGMVASTAWRNPESGQQCQKIFDVRDTKSGRAESWRGFCRDDGGIWRIVPATTPKQEVASWHQQLAAKLAAAPAAAKPPASTEAVALSVAPPAPPLTTQRTEPVAATPPKAPAAAPPTPRPEVPAPAPAQTAAVTQTSNTGAAPQSERRVLAMFNGYKQSEMCEKKAFIQPGVPWKMDGPEEQGVLASDAAGRYYAALRHAMRSLRVVYGRLAPEEEKSFNAFWAPYFDHPTQAAFDYFERLNPLLDELIVTMATMQGSGPALADTMQDYLIHVAMGRDSAADASMRAAAVQNTDIKAQRAKFDDLMRQVKALDNPPNPLAAKCAARKRHAEVLKATQHVAAKPQQPTKPQQAATPQQAGAQKPAAAAAADALWVLVKTDKDTWIQSPSWITETGRTFDIKEGSLTYTSSGQRGNAFRDKGNLFMSWALPPRTARPGKVAIDFALRRSGGEEYSDGAMLAVHYYGGDEGTAFQSWRADYDSFRYRGKTGNGEEFSCYGLNTAGEGGCTREIQFPAGAPGKVHQMVLTASAAGPSDGYRPNILGVFEYTYRWAPASTADAPAAEKEDEASAARAQREAIEAHEAMARQIEENAARFAADAARESDPARHKQLEEIANGMRDNAQAERDLAESIRTGTIVHTRTEWDERQHQNLIAGIKQELKAFDEENRMLRNIPKVAGMLEGIEGVNAREEAQKRISAALHSKDRGASLAALHGELKGKVVAQGEKQMATEEERVDRWTRRIETAEWVQWSATVAITVASLGAPEALGALPLAYGVGTGFAEGGVTGAVTGAMRGVHPIGDVLVSAFEGSQRTDPATNQKAGAWGALEGVGTSLATWAAFHVAGSTINALKKEYKKVQSLEGLARQGAGGKGVKGVAKAGEGRFKEFDFKSGEQRYKEDLAKARTPQEQAAVNKKHAVYAERDAMHQEKNAALKQAEADIQKGGGLKPDGTVNNDHPAVKKAKQDYADTLGKITKKYEAKETRNAEHENVLKEIGLGKDDLPYSGGAPKSAASDIDVTPKGKTPSESYQNGRRYVEAMKKHGHNVIEYGDRWVITGTDTTVWKPGYNADKPGSSSFEAEVIFGTLPNSDKFGTRGGIEWTSNKGETADPQGALLANMGKAVGAGLGNNKPKDLHVIGKSASKMSEIAGIEPDPVLKKQIDALRGHKTPEDAGVVDLGASSEVKKKQIDAFLAKIEALTARAYQGAKSKSEASAGSQESRLAKAANPSEAYKIREQQRGYTAGNEAALNTIAEVSPTLVAQFEPGPAGGSRVPAAGGASQRPGAAPAQPTVNIGLARTLMEKRETAKKMPPMQFRANDPALASVAARCKEGAKQVDARLQGVKPGSDEAKHLAALKTTLEKGASNPAEAVRETRLVTGHELAVVLNQLGVPSGKR